MMSGGVALFQSELRSALRAAQLATAPAHAVASAGERASAPREARGRSAYGRTAANDLIQTLELAP